MTRLNSCRSERKLGANLHWESSGNCSSRWPGLHSRNTWRTASPRYCLVSNICWKNTLVLLKRMLDWLIFTASIHFYVVSISYNIQYQIYCKYNTSTVHKREQFCWPPSPTSILSPSSVDSQWVDYPTFSLPHAPYPTGLVATSTIHTGLYIHLYSTHTC